jgi:hypothetical protein
MSNHWPDGEGVRARVSSETRAPTHVALHSAIRDPHSAFSSSLHCNISIVGIFLSGLQQAVLFLIVANVGVLTWFLARLAAAKR